ncbi:MAG: HEAT repeat domain-containing protein [Desulfobacteraceae bacterium]|nr:HEAT repeat domain-containing protein [Desulfobacteraceae bacterium]
MSPSESAGGSFRRLKRRLEPLLREAAPEVLVAAVLDLPLRQAVNPLISLFCHPEPLVRWRAVSAFGAAEAALAESEPESARVMMRRLMWQLNDESGGIGWGAPEAMGESMARSPRLAAEYHTILVSYVRLDGNFLEHPILQRGSLWAVGRLAEIRPDLMEHAGPALNPFLRSRDAHHRGLAARAAGLIGTGLLAPRLEALRNDPEMIELYQDWRLSTAAVGTLAAEALARLAGKD